MYCECHLERRRLEKLHGLMTSEGLIVILSVARELRCMLVVHRHIIARATDRWMLEACPSRSPWSINSDGRSVGAGWIASSNVFTSLLYMLPQAAANARTASFFQLPALLQDLHVYRRRNSCLIKRSAADRWAEQTHSSLTTYHRRQPHSVSSRAMPFPAAKSLAYRSPRTIIKASFSLQL